MNLKVDGVYYNSLTSISTYEDRFTVSCHILEHGRTSKKSLRGLAYLTCIAGRTGHVNEKKKKRDASLDIG